MHAIGLAVLLAAAQSFLEFDDVLVPLVSVILGLVVGELLDINAAVRRVGAAVL